MTTTSRLRTSIAHLALLATALACVAQEPVEVRRQALTRGYTISGTDNTTLVTKVHGAMGILLDKVTTDAVAFQACLNNAPLVEFSCDRTRVAADVAEGLRARNVTRIQVVDKPSGVNGCAQVDISGNEMRLDIDFLTASNELRIASVIAHELMHNRGYRHRRFPLGSPLYPNTVPEQVEACVLNGEPNPAGGPTANAYCRLRLDFEEGDGWAVGDIDGDGFDEFVHGDRGDWVRVNDNSGALVNSFPLDFEVGDGLAAGNLNGAGADEIVHADRGDRVTTYDIRGRQLSRFVLDYEEGDGFAIGDVDGDGVDEIVHGDRSDRIRIYDMRGTKLDDFSLDFEEGDRLAVGDVNGDGTDEIIHADRADTVRVLSMGGVVVNRFRLDFEIGDGLAVANVVGDGREEILHADRGNRLRAFTVNGAKVMDVPLDFERGDGFAAGNIDGDAKAEIAQADRGDLIVSF